MPIIKEYFTKSSIEFELNLNNSKGFIFAKNIPDDLCWIPYNIILTVENEKYTIDGLAFNLIGLKNFIRKIRYVIDERNITTEYCEVEYCGGENEFRIKLKNIEDDFENKRVIIEIWLNGCFIKNYSIGYDIGFRFIAKYEDLKSFLLDLQLQLNDLLEL